MKHKKNETLNLYNTNPDTRAYLIEVSLDDYSELFNGWDASPLRRRDLEPELMDYLEQAGSEIPLKEKMELCFYMPKEKILFSCYYFDNIYPAIQLGPYFTFSSHCRFIYSKNIQTKI